MSIHTGIDPRLLAAMAEQVRQLVDPITVPVRQQHRDARGRRRIRWVLVTHPPLLTQLRAACEPGAGVKGPSRHTKPRSRPSASVDAIDALHGIYRAVAAWRERVLHGRRFAGDEDLHRATLRALVGVAPTLAPSVAELLAADVARWWRTAARHSGWRPEHLQEGPR